MPCSFKPYDGDEPYLFVSYCHKDIDRIYPILEHLNKQGFRVWYDDAIGLGHEWRDDIANHIKECTVCIIFPTKNYVDSTNCQKEVKYALSKGREVVSAYLDDVELSPGLEMELSYSQAIYASKFGNATNFLTRLCSEKILHSCRGTDEMYTNSSRAVQATATKSQEKTSNNNKSSLTEELQFDFSNVLTGNNTKNDTNKVQNNTPDISTEELQFDFTKVPKNNNIQNASKDFQNNSLLKDLSKTDIKDIVLNDGVAYVPDNITNPLDVYKQLSTRKKEVKTLCGMRNLIIIGFAYSNNLNRFSNLLNINVDPENQFLKSMDGILYDKSGDKLLAYPPGRKNTVYNIPYGIREIGYMAFSFCTTLSEIHIPDGVIIINTGAFYSCKNLTSIDIPSSVMDLYAPSFSLCDKLERIDIHEDNKVYKSIDGIVFSKNNSILVKYPSAIKNCNYNVPYGVEEISSLALHGNKYLQKLYIPDSVKSIGYDAFGFMELSYIKMPKRFEKDVKKIGINKNTICEFY